MNTIQLHGSVIASTGNYSIGHFGSSYFVVSRFGKILHQGTYKHVREMWNTRYDHNNVRWLYRKIERDPAYLRAMEAKYSF